MDRRDFIKASAAAGASATLASCGNPETQLIRFIPEEPLFPGIATWKPSSRFANPSMVRSGGV